MFVCLISSGKSVYRWGVRLLRVPTTVLFLVTEILAIFGIASDVVSI